MLLWHFVEVFAGVVTDVVTVVLGAVVVLDRPAPITFLAEVSAYNL